jgi:hypothetical protein
VYRFDFWYLLSVAVSALVMLKAANLAADAVAFYCLPNGQSTVLRNKRLELVSKRSEFAEIGMKAALAAATYRSFDPDNNGSIEAIDIVRVFAHVEGVSWEQAHAIAHMILEDADTGDEGEVGGAGLSYGERARRAAERVRTDICTAERVRMAIAAAPPSATAWPWTSAPLRLRLAAPLLVACPLAHGPASGPPYAQTA